jgi:hypothetical protein
MSIAATTGGRRPSRGNFAVGEQTASLRQLPLDLSLERVFQPAKGSETGSGEKLQIEAGS